ncbi:MAG TPA: phosphoribosylamine--glycine ligase [Nonomuraea sp.]|nr:phosphoribosylamine--glycine ligase [Nonomuraea sp.]
MRSVLVVDYAGRGHAYADLFVRTDPDVVVHYAPGCEAIKHERIVSAPWLSVYDPDPAPMVRHARETGVDLVLVGHPRPLANGYVDAFRAAGLPVIGPDRAAARLESSKVYTKDLCRRHGIATAAYRWFDRPGPAVEHVRAVGAPVVVKCDYSCQGNGVFVCESVDEAVEAIERLMVARDFGPGGARVVIEDKLVGEEQLFFALVSGDQYAMLPMAVDYPRSEDGNEGPMCGGMGAFCPHPGETPEVVDRFERQILRPLLAAAKAEGLDYTGVLYADCMLVGDRLYLIEINARMGDPEAEVVFPRITTPFTEVCAAVLERRLDRCPPLELTGECFVDVSATQGPDGTHPGWPYGEVGHGHVITGLDAVDPARCQVFYGGARTAEDGRLVTDGGKVLHLVGRGDTLEQAVDHAYEAIANIGFTGIRYRTDIGKVLPWE